MKRKNEKVPEFDEIIFENRNKTYGAYNLRKRYKSATCLSILTVIAFTTILFAILSFTSERETNTIKATYDPVFKFSEPVDQIVVPPPLVKPPAELLRSIRNLQPIVVSDSNEVTTDIPITDELIANTTNGNVTDTVSVIAKDPVTPEIPFEEPIFIVVQEKPEFPGGDQALYKFIGENLNYPDEAEKNNIQGRVILQFVVNPDGSTDRIVVLRSIDPLLDNEAIRVVKTMPKFKPGKQGGVPVKVWFVLPVLFRIEGN
jgi:protein TonB